MATFNSRLIFRGETRVPISWIRTFDKPKVLTFDNVATPDDCLLIPGNAFFPSVIPGDPSPERSQGVVLKIAPGGFLDWDRAYQAGLDHLLRAIDVDASGNIFAAGQITMPVLVGHFAWILKSDVHGDPIWERRFGEDEEDRSMSFQAIVATSDGGAAAIAKHGINNDFTSGDGVLVKFDAGGGLEFARVVQGSPRMILTEAVGGDLVVSLARAVAATRVELVVVRFDSTGSVRWQRRFPELAAPQAIESLADGSVAIATSTSFAMSNKGAVVIVDANGSVITGRGLTLVTAAGDPLFLSPQSMAVTAEQGLIIAGFVFGALTGVIRLDDGVQPLWARTIKLDSLLPVRVAAIELPRTTTYLLSGSRVVDEGDFSDPQLVLARLDEDGNVGENGCGLVSAASVQSTDFDVQVEDGDLTILDETFDVNTVASNVTRPSVSITTVCQQDRVVRSGPPYVEPPLTICLDFDFDFDFPLPMPSPRPLEPEMMGLASFQRSCNDDPACPRCLQSLSEAKYLENPSWRAGLYRVLRPFTILAEGRIPARAAARVSGALAQVPSGHFFTEQKRESLNRLLAAWETMRSRKKSAYVPPSARLYPHLAQAANLIDLDLLLPERLTPEVDKEGVIAMGGLLRLRGLGESSRVMVQVVEDAPSRVPEGMAPGWPALLWKVDVPERNRDWRIELSHVGLRFQGTESRLRLIQWRGDNAADITSYVDRRLRSVGGNASGSGVFAVLEYGRGSASAGTSSQRRTSRR